MVRILFIFSSLISGCFTIFAFWTANRFTATFDLAKEMYGGGNGNPGLFMLVLFNLIILYFAFTVVLIFEAIHENLSKKIKLLLCGIYFSLAAIIFTRMLWDANHLKDFINEYHPYMQVGLLNQFSNNIFFNVSTFIGAISLMAMLSFLMTRKKGRNSQ